MGLEGKYHYRFIYLKSEEWRGARIEALARDQCKCRVCGFTSLQNDAHHINYPSSFWTTEKEDLVTVCRPCHELLHAIIPNFHNKRKQSRKKFEAVSGALQDWLKRHEGMVLHGQMVKPDCRFCRQTMDSVEMRNIKGVENDDHIAGTWPVCGPCWRELNQIFPAPRSWTQIRLFKDRRLEARQSLQNKGC